MAAGTLTQPTTEQHAEPTAPNRIDEHDADYTRLHAGTVARLQSSIRRYVRELRASGHDVHRQMSAAQSFIQRHTKLLRDAYTAGYREGLRDYYGGASASSGIPSGVTVTPTSEQQGKRLSFYAPSVAKMAAEGLRALQAEHVEKTQTAKLSEGILLVGGHEQGYDEQPHGYHGQWGPGQGKQSGGTGQRGAGNGNEQEPKGGGGGGGARAAQPKESAAEKHAAKVRETARAKGKAAAQGIEGEQKAPVRRTAGAKIAGAKPEAGAKPAKESIHERSARLQQEGGLQAEARPGEELQVTGTRNAPHNPFASPTESIAQMHDLYGDRQLGNALKDMSYERMKEAIREYQAQGHTVALGRSRAEALSNIVAHVTGGKYSANFGGASATKAASKTVTEKAARQPKAAKGEKAQEKELTPIGSVEGYVHDPLAAMSPHYLRAIYGDHQLEEALGQYSHETLKSAARRLGFTRVGASKAATAKIIADHVRESPYEQSVRIAQGKAEAPLAKAPAQAKSAKAQSSRG